MAKKQLKKSLGLLDVFAIGTGAMISSGFFLLPGIAASMTGPAVIVAYMLSAFLILPSLFSIAELATAMPRSGGTYFFISRSLGQMFGTIDGIGDWLALVFKCSIALMGLGAYLSALFGIDPTGIALLFSVIFMLVNLVGAKESSRLQIGMVLFLFAIMAFFMIRGAPAVHSEYYRPFAPFGWSSVFPTAGFVFISYIGLTKVASVSEEVKNPERNIPLGMILSLAAVTIIYGVGLTIVVGVLPKEQLYSSLTPLADAAGYFAGRNGVIAITIAAILAFATTGNAGLMSASRYLLAMGRDRVIPHRFSRLSKYKTPWNAILMTSAIVMIIVVLIDVEHVAKLASTFQILVFGLINVAVLVMRESGIKSYDPGFKSPLYPWTQIVGILIAVVLIPEMGILSTIFSLVLVGLGVVWYNLYVRHRVGGVPAFAKMAERVAERLLSQDAHALGLDKELRQILKEKGLRRDDPFAKMIEEAEFLEVRADQNIEDILRHASQILGKKSGVSADLILGAVLERSRLGETPAEAGVALPHLLLDEVDDFYLVFARSIKGIDFPMSDQSIHAIFVLLGSRSDPSQHLRFLAEIARRAEDPNFIDSWIDADGREKLIELLLTEKDTSS